MSSQAVCTFEAGRWRQMLQRGELDGSPVGMLVDVVDRATGEVERLVLADDGWVSVDR